MLTGSRPDPIAAVNRPDTIVARFVSRASSDPERMAFTLYPMGALQSLGSVTWGEWLTGSRAVSGAFLAGHGNVGDRVAIFAENRAIWPVAAMGIAMSGMVVVAIPPSGSPDDVFAQLEDSGSTYVIVDTIARFKMIRAMQHKLSRSIIIVCDDLEPLRSSVAEGVFEWETWCRYGARALNEFAVLRERLAQRLDGNSAERMASITYSEGSSIGIVRTFETRLADAQAIGEILGLSFTDRLTCSQSLSQPFHATLCIDVAVLSGAAVELIEHEGDAFSASRNFEATVFAGSSRSLSQVHEAMLIAGQSGGYSRDTICEYVGRHCRLIATADDVCSAAFAKELGSGGVKLVTLYGSEWQTCISVNGPEQFADRAIGAAFSNVAVRIGDHGELQVGRSAHTAAGCYNRNDCYDAAFSGDGQWHGTGHRVERSMSGSFRIVGRMRDMLEFATGRLFEPHAIESSLAALPLVAHAVCQADGVDSLVAILSLDRRRVEDWALMRGVVAPWEALVEHPVIYEELARGVESINAQHDVGERVKAFAPTDLEFSVHTGELDDSGELVRSVIDHRFRHVFAELHQRRTN